MKAEQKLEDQAKAVFQKAIKTLSFVDHSDCERCREVSKAANLLCCCVVGWTRIEATSEPGRYYYYDERTGESQWEHPSTEASKVCTMHQHLALGSEAVA